MTAKKLIQKLRVEICVKSKKEFGELLCPTELTPEILQRVLEQAYPIHGGDVLTNHEWYVRVIPKPKRKTRLSPKAPDIPWVDVPPEMVKKFIFRYYIFHMPEIHTILGLWYYNRGTSEVVQGMPNSLTTRGGKKIGKWGPLHVEIVKELVDNRRRRNDSSQWDFGEVRQITVALPKGKYNPKKFGLTIYNPKDHGFISWSKELGRQFAIADYITRFGDPCEN